MKAIDTKILSNRKKQMNIKHNPIFDTQKVERIYTEKDGVSVTYVCTSAPNRSAAYAADIFFRETPHPEFGNRYFGLYLNAYSKYEQIMIINADKIEELEFNMVEVDGILHYSQHRHDFRSVGDVAIDGGREYCRRVGNLSHPMKTLKVKDGKFVEA